MTLKLTGAEPSRAIKEWVSGAVASLKKKHGIEPTMTTVQIGENPASERYVRNQLKTCGEVGIATRTLNFDWDIPKKDFLREIAAISRDQGVDGIMLQRPFPESWNVDEILSALPSTKDVEGVHPENLGRLYLGELKVPQPCTARAALSLLEWYGRSSFEQNRCAIVGRSPNVGRAIAIMLMHRHGTVTVCHTKTSEEQIKETIAGSDVVIVAAGVAGMIKARELPRRSWVVDVGTNVTAEGKLVGDVSPDADGWVDALSPVPGGIGPLTVSLLTANLLLCTTRRRLGESWMLPNLESLKKGL